MAINFPSTAGQATDGSFTYNVAGIVYAWNGSSWAAAGAGASATDTSLFSVTTNSPSGGGQLTYTAGTFSYTPPNLSGYLTSEVDTLGTVTGRGNSTTSGITLSTSNLILDSASDQRIQHNVSGAETSKIIFRSTGAIDYYASNGMNFYATSGVSPINRRISLLTAGGTQLEYQSSIRLTTTSGGVEVSGTLTAGGLTYPNSNGSLGQVLTSDGTGGVTWTSAGLSTRDTSAMGSTTIANGGDATPNISTPKTYALLSIETTHAVWVTLYNSDAARTADNSRGINTDPIPGTGVLAEVITTGAQTQYLSPGVICYNTATTGITYAKVRNLSGSTNAINVTLTHVKLEA